MKICLVTLAWLASAVAVFGVPAFPGAEGFGAESQGGRGGRLIEVTNLNDTGPGSFRAAVEAEGPRTVVFRTGGTIELMSEVVVAHPFLTIAGQTAPDGGITLKTHPSNHRSALTIAKTAHDVIIRCIRSRPGPHDGFPKLKSGRAADTSEVKDALQILGAKRVIVDHCSFSWATDEVLSTYFDAQDVTIQWCIISEALRKSRPDQELPGKGLLIGSKGGARISVHHNLMVHNVGRNPLIKTAGIVDVVNNVVLAPAEVAMAIDDEHGHSPANFVGNRVLLPNAENDPYGLIVMAGKSYALFLKDNLTHRRDPSKAPVGVEDFVKPNNKGREWIVARPHEAPPVATHSAGEVLDVLLHGVGCIVPARDAVDERLIRDVQSAKSRIVDRPEEVGGWPELSPGTAPADTDHDGMPDDWETAHRLNPTDPSDGNGDSNDDGYTHLEEYLNSLISAR